MSKVKIEEIIEDNSLPPEQSKPSNIQNIEILKKKIDNKNTEEKTTNVLPNVQQDENTKTKDSVNEIIELNEKLVYPNKYFFVMESCYKNIFIIYILLCIY